MKKFIVCFIILFLIFTVVNAEEKWDGRTGGQILRINPSVRSMATGQGFISNINGVQSTSINPAGIAGIKRRQASFSHVELFDNFRVEYLGYAQKIHSVYLSIETKGYFFQYTQIDSAENEIKDVSSYSLAPSLGLALNLMENFLDILCTKYFIQFSRARFFMIQLKKR